jgi:hypothetical protein
MTWWSRRRHDTTTDMPRGLNERGTSRPHRRAVFRGALLREIGEWGNPSLGAFQVKASWNRQCFSAPLAAKRPPPRRAHMCPAS